MNQEQQRVGDLWDGGIRGGISPRWQRTKGGQENDLGVCGWEKETTLKRTGEELGSSGSIPEVVQEMGLLTMEPERQLGWMGQGVIEGIREEEKCKRERKSPN